MTLQKRLQWCLKHGNLTVADLARWFDRPDPTVRGWASGSNVRAAPLDAEAIEASLTRLEAAIKQKRGFPVPQLRNSARMDHLERVRNAPL